MKPFDLEAAKRGEPIVYTGLGGKMLAHFIGVIRNGSPVVEIHDESSECGYITAVSARNLRMASKKKVWYCRHWLEAGGVPRLHASRTPMDGDANARWHGPEFTIEVEE